MNVLHELWYGDSAAARAARGVLTPASWLYRAGVAVRNWHYDNPDAVCQSAVPALSLGNLAVGGTGKTPVAAWAAAAVLARGGSPAIVLRGYGDDESLVHRRLNPDVPVIVSADRVHGALLARAAGADCIILDDGFQHRRIARVSDWVLVPAETWRDDLSVLPAGPLREPIGACARADVLLITRKSATRDTAERVATQLSARFPGTATAMCHLRLDALVNAVTAERRSLASLEGRSVLAIAAVGAPDAFFAQLRSLGAVVQEYAYRDHHAFSSDDVRRLLALAATSDVLVCTLKDAVKLAPRWPPASAPLWYVSQIAVIEHGRSLLDHALESVLAARQLASLTAGSAGPSTPGHGHRSSTAD